MAKGRILAIDDEEFFRRMYLDLLGAEGYFVRLASSGAEGLACLRDEEFDLVITDMEMAGMNGVETTEAIKRLHPEQEVMVVTAKREVTFAVEAMKRGVSEYILKPIIPEEFLHLVGQILFRQSMRVEHQKLVEENIEYHAILASYRKCLAFLGQHDLDRLGDLVLDTLMDLLRAEGALLWIARSGGPHYRLRCLRGLSKIPPGQESFEAGAGEQRLFLSGKPAFAAKGDVLQVPLLAGSAPLGLILVEMPSGRDAFNRTDLEVAAMASEFAAGALDNTLRLRNLEQDSLRVPLTEAYNMAYFHDHVERELYKSRRYGRHLAIVKLRIENYRDLKPRFLDREMEAGLQRLVAVVNTVLRDADILAMAAPDEFFILLPETDYWGALVAQKRIRKAVGGQLPLSGTKTSAGLRIHLRAGAFPNDGASFEALSAAADRRLEGLPKSLFLRRNLETASFWSATEGLLAEAAEVFGGEAGAASEPATVLRHGTLSDRFIRLPLVRLAETMRAFCREVVESHRVRGIIYCGCGDFDKALQAFGFPEEVEQSATSLFLLGGNRRVHWNYQHIVPIFLEEERFRHTTFLLYLNQDYAYALLARKQGNALIGFHTSDFFFVENMIDKLQQHYRLRDPF